MLKKINTAYTILYIATNKDGFIADKFEAVMQKYPTLVGGCFDAE